MREARSSAPGLYLHIPFCSAICPYCDFSVMHAASPARQRFASRLVAEVSLAAAAWRDPRPFDTVYFGGGTPSQLPHRRARARARRVPHAPRIRDARAVGLPRGQPRGRDAGSLRRMAGARRAHAVSRGAVLLGRGAALPRPPSQRTTGACRGRDGARPRASTRCRSTSSSACGARPRRTGGSTWPRLSLWSRSTCRAISSRSTRARGSGCRRSTASSRSFPRTSRRSSSSSPTASSRMPAGRRTRSPTSRAARPTSRGTIASTGTTRRTSASARRRTRSPPRTLRRRPAAGGTSEARRAGSDDSRRASVRSRRRRSLGPKDLAAEALLLGLRTTAGIDLDGFAGALRCRPAGRERQPSSLASWTRAASSCAPTRRAAAGWCRRCPDWPSQTAWPRRSTCRSELKHGRRSGLEPAVGVVASPRSSYRVGPDFGSADSSAIWRSALARSWSFAASSAFVSRGSTSSTLR